MSIRRYLSFGVYLVVHLVWLPMTLLAQFLLFQHLVKGSRRLKCSQTTVLVLNWRWILDIFELRSDTTAALLANSLPNNSPLGVRLLIFPDYVYFVLSGGDSFSFRTARPHYETVRDLLTNSCFYVDAMVARNASNCEQFVLLNAGCDTRSYNNGPVTRMERYEVDYEETQGVKVEALAKAGVFTKGVKFAKVGAGDIAQSLQAVGFDPEKRTVFLWEGATLHLTEDNVRRTLRAVKELGAEGSVLITEFYGTRLFQSPRFKAVVQRVLDLTDEHIRFLMDFKDDARREIESLVLSEGLHLGKRHVMGSKTSHGAYMAVVEIII